jgi:hypothetical protein
MRTSADPGPQRQHRRAHEDDGRCKLEAILQVEGGQSGRPAVRHVPGAPNERRYDHPKRTFPDNRGVDLRLTQGALVPPQSTLRVCGWRSTVRTGPHFVTLIPSLPATA